MFTKKEILPILLIIIAIIIGFQMYSSLPDKVPTHWNAQGEVDAMGNKDFAVFFFPALAIGIYVLMLFIPLIDPFRKKYEAFVMPYFWIRTIIIAFLLAIYLFSLFAAAGIKLNIIYVIVPALSIMFIVLGLLMPKIKRNYFVGIRTPWTIHSEEVWNKTHKFGGKAFVIAGIVSLLALVVKEYVLSIFITVIIIASLLPVVYSYFVFKNIGGFKE